MARSLTELMQIVMNERIMRSMRQKALCCHNNLSDLLLYKF
jgi:hypothetical protein